MRTRSSARSLLSITLAALLSVAAASHLSAQAAATICKDGSSSAVTGRGACSGHGGVDKKASKAAEKEQRAAQKSAAKAERAERKSEAKADRAADAMVACTDGSMSKPGRGACSRHGGVRTAQATAPNATAVPAAPREERRSAPAAEARESREAREPRSASATGRSTRSEDNDPTGAIAQCKDGLYSHAAHRQGACSRHQGVAKWISG